MINEIRYEIKLNFKPGLEKPSRIFSSLAKIIESVKRTDEILGKSINCKVHTKQVLDEISTGSIITKICEFIEIEDNAFCNEETNQKVENYFNKSKKEIVKALENGSIEKSSDVNTLAEKIERIANNEKLPENLGFTKPNPIELLTNLHKIADSTAELTNEEFIEFKASDGEQIKLLPNTKIFIESIKEEMISKTIPSDRILILKIKKPDYLGESKWEFRHRNSPVFAKIIDEEWMRKFHTKEIVIGPGDALEVDMQTIDNYDVKGNLISSEHNIKKIIDVINNGENYEY